MLMIKGACGVWLKCQAEAEEAEAGEVLHRFRSAAGVFVRGRNQW